MIGIIGMHSSSPTVTLSLKTEDDAFCFQWFQDVPSQVQAVQVLRSEYLGLCRKTVRMIRVRIHSWEMLGRFAISGVVQYPC